MSHLLAVTFPNGFGMRTCGADGKKHSPDPAWNQGRVIAVAYVSGTEPLIPSLRARWQEKKWLSEGRGHRVAGVKGWEPPASWPLCQAVPSFPMDFIVGLPWCVTPPLKSLSVGSRHRHVHKDRRVAFFNFWNRSNLLPRPWREISGPPSTRPSWRIGTSRRSIWLPLQRQRQRQQGGDW